MRPLRHTSTMTGHYMQSGTYVEPFDLQPEMVRVEDIAHHLGNQCRFNGGTKPFYSVAQHSIHVSALLAPHPVLMLWGLMHDAPEAYLGDMPSPTKHSGSEYARLFREADTQAMIAIADALELPTLTPTQLRKLKKADLVALATEKRDLMPNIADVKWDVLKGIVPDRQRILHPYDGEEARVHFLRTWQRLTAKVVRKEAA